MKKLHAYQIIANNGNNDPVEQSISKDEEGKSIILCHPADLTTFNEKPFMLQAITYDIALRSNLRTRLRRFLLN